MKIYRIYESVVNEAGIKGCVAKFGNELFGTELGGTEKNTELENDYLDKIIDFTDISYGHDIDPLFVSALKTLKGCMTQYPEVLIPENARVYRGITIPIKYFIDNKQQIFVDAKNEYVYKANNKIQSWSTSYESASMFGGQEILNEIAKKIDLDLFNTPESRRNLLSDLIAEDLRIGVVIQYNTNPEEFIFKSKYFSKLSSVDIEEEVIRFDNKPINVIAWFNVEGETKMSNDGSMLINYINKAISEL